MSSKKEVIKVKGLNKTFGKGKKKNQVIKDLDLKIYSGEFAVLFGPSGCGKTTLVNCITGLEPPNSGKVVVRGEEITAMSADKRANFRSRKFGIVYQMPYWVKSLTVIENVGLPLTISGTTEKFALRKAEKALERVGIEKLAGQIPTELSGGEQQRAGVARALVTWPWIIIADEPTGNLDVESGKKLMDFLKKLNKKQKRTILLVTHNLNYLRYATRRIGMEDGKIVGDSTQKEGKMVKELEDKIKLLRKQEEKIKKQEGE